MSSDQQCPFKQTNKKIDIYTLNNNMHFFKFYNYLIFNLYPKEDYLKLDTF